MSENEHFAKGFLTAILVLLVAPAIGVVASVVQGYAFSVMWQWFVVESFGVPPLRIPAAIGIAFIVFMLTYHKCECKDKEKKDTTDRFIELIVVSFAPLITLGFAWIAHKFM
jgi:hypothetical protein